MAEEKLNADDPLALDPGSSPSIDPDPTLPETRAASAAEVVRTKPIGASGRVKVERKKLLVGMTADDQAALHWLMKNLGLSASDIVRLALREMRVRLKHGV